MTKETSNVPDHPAVAGGAAVLHGREALIRPLTQPEKALRAKHVARLAEKQAALQKAAADYAVAREFLNDLALAFHGGDGPVTMTEDGLYEVADD